MILKDFLTQSGTEKNLAELILFLSEQADPVKKGFLTTCMNTVACGTRNMFGEDQKPLDKYADDVFVQSLKKSRLVRYIATEEQDTIIEVNNAKNNFGVVIDPLDGSSLLDVNLCVGSIIGIYAGHVLTKGSAMIAALYMLYGPLTLLTITTGHGVHEFVRDESGEFVLRGKDIRIPDGKIYAPGALRRDWLPLMPGGLTILKTPATSSGSAAVLSQTSTRSSTRVGCSPIRDTRERKRENCGSCMRQTPWV